LKEVFIYPKPQTWQILNILSFDRKHTTCLTIISFGCAEDIIRKEFKEHLPEKTLPVVFFKDLGKILSFQNQYFNFNPGLG
jgi:hypothetical protein